MRHNWITDENGNPDEWIFENGFHNGVICRDCGKSVCVQCHPDYMEMDDCPGAPARKAVTNADRIRAMSDEELADFIDRVYGGYMHPLGGWVNRGWFKWLQRPVEEEEK